MQIAEIFVKLALDAKNYADGLARAGKQAADFANQANGAANHAVGAFGRIGGAIGDMAKIAGGIIAAQLFDKLAGGIMGFAKTGLEAVGSAQQLEIALGSLLTQNNMYAQVTETTTQAITKQLMTQDELSQKTTELTAKLETQRATYQEQAEQIRQMAAVWTDEGLNVKKLKAQHNQLAVAIQETERDIAGLTTTETKYVGVTKTTWKEVMSQADAAKIAARETKDLLQYISELAVVSPFETEDVEQVTKYAIAAGLSVKQVKEFSAGFLDLAASVGIGSESLGFAADQLFQVKKIGKLTEIDLRQLRRLGIDLAKVLEIEMGMSVEEFNTQAAKSPEIFDELFTSITRFSKNTFAGTAKEMAFTVKGIQSTLNDIFVIGARNLFRPLVDAASPAVAKIVGKLSGMVLGGDMTKIGQQAAEFLGKGFSQAFSKFNAIKNAFGRSTGEGARMMAYFLGASPESLQIIQNWADKAKQALVVFQTGGLFGTENPTSGQKGGGLLRMLGINEESIAIIQSVVSQVSQAFTVFTDTLNTSLGGITQEGVLNGLAVGFALVVSGIVTGINIIVPAIANLVTWLQTNLPVAIEYVTGLWNIYFPTIAATVLTAWTVLQAVFNGIVQGLTISVGPAIQQLGETFSNLGINWATVGNALLQAVGYVFAGIGAIILVAISVVTGLVGAVVTAVSTMISFWDELMIGFATVGAGIVTTLTALRDFWVAIWSGDIPAALQAAKTGFYGIYTTFTGLFSSIQAALHGFGGFVYGFFAGFVDTVVGFWQGLFDTLVGHSIVPDMINGIIDLFASLPEKITGALSKLTEIVSGIFSGLFGNKEGQQFNTQSIIDNALLAIQNGINPLDTAIQNLYLATLPALLSVFTSTFNQLSSILIQVGTDIVPVAKNIGVQIVTGIQNGWNATVGTITELFTTGVESWTAIITETDWLEIGMGIVDGIEKGITENMNKVLEMMKELAKMALNSAKRALGIGSPSKEFAVIGGNIIQGLMTGIDTNTSAFNKKLSSSLQHAISLSSNLVQQQVEGRQRIRNLFTSWVGQSQGNLSNLTGEQVKASIAQYAQAWGGNAKYTIDQMIKQGYDFGKLATKMRDAYNDFMLTLRLENIAGSLGTVSAFTTFEQAMVDRLNGRIEALQAIVDEGGGEYLGQIYSQVEAQDALNSALQEQLTVQEQITALAKQQSDLEFLQQQVNLLQLVQDKGLNISDIFSGITFGLDASIPDLINATSNVVNAMIGQINKDLQIASPSKVMAQIGEYMNQGLAKGLGDSMSLPVGAMCGAAQSIVNKSFTQNIYSNTGPGNAIGQFQMMSASFST